MLDNLKRKHLVSSSLYQDFDEKEFGITADVGAWIESCRFCQKPQTQIFFKDVNTLIIMSLKFTCNVTN